MNKKEITFKDFFDDVVKFELRSEKDNKPLVTFTVDEVDGIMWKVHNTEEDYYLSFKFSKK